MRSKLNQDEAAGADGNAGPQVDYENRAKYYLKAIGKTPTEPVSKEARELHSRLREAVKYLRERQREYHPMYPGDVLPSYEMLTDTLANLVCDMWTHVEYAQMESET